MPWRIPRTVPTAVNTLAGDTVDISTPAGETVDANNQYRTPIYIEKSYVAQQTNTVIWTPAAGKTIVITDIMVSTEDQGQVSLNDETDLIRDYFLAAGGGAVENLEIHKALSAADNRLMFSTSATMNIFIAIGGYEK